MNDEIDFEQELKEAEEKKKAEELENHRTKGKNLTS